MPAGLRLPRRGGAGRPQPGPWADQGAVLAALGWDRGDERYYRARPGAGGAFLDGTSWLPPGWNQPYLGGRVDGELYNSCARSYADRPDVADPHTPHFMGMTPPLPPGTWERCSPTAGRHAPGRPSPRRPEHLPPTTSVFLLVRVFGDGAQSSVRRGRAGQAISRDHLAVLPVIRTAQATGPPSSLQVAQLRSELVRR